jgi:hypothetical protein
MYNQEIEEKQEIVQNVVYLHDQYATYSNRIFFLIEPTIEPYQEKFMTKTNPFFFD